MTLQEIRIINSSPSDFEAASEQVDVSELDDGVESVCSWEGGVASWSDTENDTSEILWLDDTTEDEDEQGEQLVFEEEADEEIEVPLEGAELDASLQQCVELKDTRVKSAFAVLMDKKRTAKQWKDIERTRIGGYNGRADRTERLHRKQAREKEEEASKMRETYIILRSLLRTRLTSHYSRHTAHTF